jgi:hypothetical protein
MQWLHSHDARVYSELFQNPQWLRYKASFGIVGGSGIKRSESQNSHCALMVFFSDPGVHHMQIRLRSGRQPVYERLVLPCD